MRRNKLEICLHFVWATCSDTKKWITRLSVVLNRDDYMLVVKMELPTQAVRLPGYAMDWLEKYLPKSAP